MSPPPAVARFRHDSTEFGRHGFGIGANWLGRKRGTQRAADHQFDDLGVRYIVHCVGADCSAVAKNREHRAKGTHLLHAMGDKDHRRAGTLEPFDHVAEPLHVAVGQRRGGLVEQQDAQVAADSAGDLYFLPRRQIESAHLRTGIN